VIETRRRGRERMRQVVYLHPSPLSKEAIMRRKKKEGNTRRAGEAKVHGPGASKTSRWEEKLPAGDRNYRMEGYAFLRPTGVDSSQGSTEKYTMIKGSSGRRSRDLDCFFL